MRRRSRALGLGHRSGDAIVFGADIAHSDVNPGHQEACMYLVMTYQPRPA